MTREKLTKKNPTDKERKNNLLTGEREQHPSDEESEKKQPIEKEREKKRKNNLLKERERKKNLLRMRVRERKTTY